ncbi:MAG TPA: hypothetical protein VKG45_09720 [Actinomycetes bacterium]|nr:hypothetical protein [Actinomycetes bacterium]
MDLVRSLVATAGVLAEPGPALQLPSGPDVPSVPGPGAAALAASAGLALGWRPEEAAAGQLSARGNGGGGRQGSGATSPAQPRPGRLDATKVSELMSDIRFDATRLGRWIARWKGQEALDLAQEAQDDALLADRYANDARGNPAVPASVLSKMRGAAAASGALGKLAQEVARDQTQGSEKLHAEARAAEQQAAIAKGAAAVANGAAPPKVLPKALPDPRPEVAEVVEPVVQEALELSTLITNTMRALARDPAQATRAEVQADKLTDDLVAKADDAKESAFQKPPRARDGMAGAVAKLLALAKLAHRMADSLGEDGKALQEAADLAVKRAEGVRRAVEEDEGFTSPRKGERDVPGAPPDESAVQQAGVDEPEPGTAAAATQDEATQGAAGAGPTVGASPPPTPGGVTAPVAEQGMTADLGPDQPSGEGGGPRVSDDSLPADPGDPTLAGVG